MKILVTGVNGQLGYDVTRELLRRNITKGITRTNTEGITKYEIIGTDVVLPEFWTNNEELRMKNEEWKGSRQLSVDSSQSDFKELTNSYQPAAISHHELKVTGLCDCAHKQGAKRELFRLCEVAYPSPMEKDRDKATGFCDCAQKDALTLVTLDITDKEAVNRIIIGLAPDAVVHCAAWTAVDAAEDNVERCRAVNVEGTRNIAEACAKIGAKMIYISTDYVFSGEGAEPYQPDCRDFAPQNVYGQSKLDGEFAVAENLEKFFIVRTAWVFGNHGNNFVKTMLKVGATHDEVRVVNDQIGTPTYTPDLAKLLCDMAESDKYGYYHATNEGGFISWYDFTCEIYRQAGYTTKVIPVTTAEYGLSKAKRPLNSRLDKSKLQENGFERLPSWQHALQDYIE